MSRLTHAEVMRVVTRYIGTQGGYLGDFSYSSHEEFYPLYCELDINPSQVPGTTRQRFIKILSDASAADQCRILKGVLARFPVDAPSAPAARASARDDLLRLIARLEGASPVVSHTPEDASLIVEQAILEAETLIRAHGAASGLDRVHTALQGFLRELCTRASIDCEPRASTTALLTKLRKEHPAFRANEHRRQEITSVLRSMGAIADALDTLRNNASPAHPNERLEEAEAMLIVDTVRTVLRYIDNRVRAHARGTA